jgi:hypothetical protein
VKNIAILALLLGTVALPAMAFDANGAIVGGVSGTGAAGSSSASTHGDGLAVGGSTVDVATTGKTSVTEKGNKQTITQSSETAGSTLTGGLSLGHASTSNSTVYTGGTIQGALGGQVKAH